MYGWDILTFVVQKSENLNKPNEFSKIFKTKIMSFGVDFEAGKVLEMGCLDLGSISGLDMGHGKNINFLTRIEGSLS
jgi:hypothetical protein